jgi:hypothetical protein
MIIVCVACVALASVALWLRPRQFTTFSDAIGYSLIQHDIGYEQIYIDHSWPNTVNTIRYAANLDVRLPGRSPIYGQLECRIERTTCFYSLPSLGIMNEPLPDLVEERETPVWLLWAEDVLDQLAGRG